MDLLFILKNIKKIQLKRNLIGILNDKYDLEDEEVEQTYKVLMDLYDKNYIEFNQEIYKNKNLVLKFY